MTRRALVQAITQTAPCAICEIAGTDLAMALRMLEQRRSETPTRRPRGDLAMAPGIHGETGAVNERCHACGAYLHLFDDNTIECLNLCSWPHWMVQEFQSQMTEAVAATRARQRASEEVLAVL